MMLYGKTADEITCIATQKQAMLDLIESTGVDPESTPGKRLIKKLEERLAIVRTMYYGIDVTKEPTHAVAEVAKVQGREAEVEQELAFARDSRQAMNQLQAEIHECDKQLVRLEQERQMSREIGDT